MGRRNAVQMARAVVVQKEWLAANPEKRRAMANARRVRDRENPTALSVARNLRRAAAQAGYELTAEKRDAMLDKQEHRCAVCERPFRVPNWHLVCAFEGKSKGRKVTTGIQVDHDHTTGRVRGLLCVWCNRTVVDLVEKHADIMQRAIEYLR